MKRIYILFIALSAFFITGCQNDPIIYSGPDFVSFDKSTLNQAIKENGDGIVEITLGVSKTSNKDRTFNVVVDAANSDAVEGQHYDFVNKSVVIPAGKYIGTIKIKGYYNNLPKEGNKKLVLKLDADEAMLQEGTTTSMAIYLSRFFELKMDWLVGTWVWTDYDYSTGETTGEDTYRVKITKVSDNKITIYNVWNGGKTITATLDFEKGQIVIDPDQVIFVDQTYGNVTMAFFNGSTDKTAKIIGQCSFHGISIDGWTAIVDAGYFGRYKSNIVKQE